MRAALLFATLGALTSRLVAEEEAVSLRNYLKTWIDRPVLTPMQSGRRAHQERTGAPFSVRSEPVKGRYLQVWVIWR